MAAKLCHKALAESHDLVIALALGVKVTAALTAADRKTCKGVLKDLLKAEELDDSEVNRRMQTDTALIGADSRIELYAVTCVYVDLTVIIDPRNAELDLTLGLTDAL